MPKLYCRPLCAGIDSEPLPVGHRVGKLLTILDQSITAMVVEGEIVDDVKALRAKITDRLKDEGWRIFYKGAVGSVHAEPPKNQTARVEELWKATPFADRCYVMGKKKLRALMIERGTETVIVPLEQMTTAEVTQALITRRETV